MIKASIHQEDITIINIYVTNIGTSKYIKQILTSVKREADSNTIIAGDFNTPLSTKDRSCRQKINKKMMDWNYTIDKEVKSIQIRKN